MRDNTFVRELHDHSQSSVQRRLIKDKSEEWSLPTLIRFLYFWEKLYPKWAEGRMPEDEQDEIRQRLKDVKDQSLQVLIKSWEDLYQSLCNDLAAVRTRAASLLSATGIIAGVVALVTPLGTWLAVNLRFKSAAAIGLGVMILIVIGALLYCGVAAAFLAVRAQEVGPWSLIVMRIHPSRDKHDNEIEYGHSIYVASMENKDILRRIYVRYLNDAQLYFRLLVIVLAVLVIVALLGLWLGQPTSSPSRGTQAL